MISNFSSTQTCSADVNITQPSISQLKGTALNLLTLEQAGLAFESMSSVNVKPGEEIIKQGEAGENYFLLEAGEAEVWRTDPFSDETSLVAVLAPGNVFGEEALLIAGSRNATVRMRSAGRVRVLFKNDFYLLLRHELVNKIHAKDALALVTSGDAYWLDCRYEMEFSETHIPSAIHLPLDQIRNCADKLDSSKTYIAYCRSGKRSDAAAYLLRERGINTYSLRGGIVDFPYAISEPHKA